MSINDQQRYKNNDKIDDEDGHYIVQEGSSIANRYNLVNLLGQGTFGKVVRARDSKNKEFAVKIIRAVPKVLHKIYHRSCRAVLTSSTVS
jgi:serine/threonine protein kinase